MELIALRSFPYAGKRLKAGDRFTARGKQDGNLLKALKHAADAPVVAPVAPPAPVEPVKRAYVRRDVTPDVPPVGSYSPKAPDPIRQFSEAVEQRLGDAIDRGEGIEGMDGKGHNKESEEAKPDEPRQKRAYRRRDMTAE